MDDLKDLRNKIDVIDKEMVELLNKRAVLALEVRAIKIKNGFPVFDGDRENEILKNISLLNDGPLNESQLKEIYASILKCMKDFS